MDKHQQREEWLLRLDEDSQFVSDHELVGDEDMLAEFREDDFVDRLLGAHFEEQDEDSFVAQFASRLEEVGVDARSDEPSDEPVHEQAVATIYPVADHPIDAPPIQAPVSVAAEKPGERVDLARPGIFAGTAAYLVLTACLMIAVIVVAWNRPTDSTGEATTAHGSNNKSETTNPDSKKPDEKGKTKTAPKDKPEPKIDAPKQQLAKKSIPENPFKPVSPETLNNLNNDKQVADNDPDKQTPPESTEPQSVALLVDSKDAVWEGSRPGRKLPKGALYLSRGSARLQMDSGAVVDLKAPAELDLRDQNSLVLHKGHLAAQVPPAAKGFAVNTPSARVVDLGTEFTVDVAEAGATDVKVTKGSVELSLPKAPRKPVYSMRAGDQLSVTADGLKAYAWVAAIQVQPKTLEGSLTINGQNETFKDVAGLHGAFRKLTTEMIRLRVRLARRNGTTGKLDLNGTEFQFSNTAELSRAQRMVVKKWQELLRAVPKTSTNRARNNGTNTQIEFGNGSQRLQEMQEEIQRMLQNGMQQVFPFGGGR